MIHLPQVFVYRQRKGGLRQNVSFQVDAWSDLYDSQTLRLKA